MAEKIARLPMTSDYIFKRVFSYEGNEDVLRDFLEAILNIKINKVIVKNPELIKSDNNYHNIARMKFEETTKKAYVDMGYKEEQEIASKYIEMHFIEMPKFRKKNPNTEAKLEQWLWLIDGREEKVEMAEKENKEVKKAIETLNRISLDPQERERYESIIQAEFNRRVSEQNFYKKGMAKGIKQTKIEMARKLLKINIDTKQIKEITSLTEEIKEIQKEI